MTRRRANRAGRVSITTDWYTKLLNIWKRCCLQQRRGILALDQRVEYRFSESLITPCRGTGSGNTSASPYLKKTAIPHKIRKNFSGYKAKTGIPYTLIYLHEASGFYGPKTLEIRGKR